MPRNEPFRQHQPAVLELVLKLLNVENEENAAICIKIIIEVIHQHKDQAEPFVARFIEWIKQLYQNVKEIVENEYGPGAVRIIDG